MNYPVEYDFPPAYKGDGLIPFTLTLLYPNSEPVVQPGSTLLMQLRAFDGAVAWEFSSEAEGERKLTIQTDGVIEFPLIKSWDIDAKEYKYDLEETDSSGFVRTRLKGKWSVSQDITHG